MKLRHTLWLILIFVGLFLYLAFIEAPSKQKENEEEARSKQVFHFKVEEVDSFDIIRPSGTIKIKRDPQNTLWNIIHPLAVKGEDGIINQYLLTLEEARITRVVEEDPKSLADFGLKDPPLKIEMRFKTGEPKTLLVGNASPIGHDTYIKRADEKRVLLSFLDNNLLHSSLNDLRSKTLLDFATRDVTSVELRQGKKTQRFVKEGEQWNLTSPINSLGDADEISNFLNRIRTERIATFISETPEDLASRGLKSPDIVLHIQAEKAKRSWILKVGKPHDKGSYYAQRGQPENIITISKGLLETLSRLPVSFLEKSLVTFKEEDVTAIESRDRKKTVRVVRNTDHKEQWQFENPENGTVDSATVNTLLLDLQEARIHNFAPSTQLKVFGLDVPQKELTVFKKDGSKTTLRLGNNNRNKHYYFITRSTDQTIFDLDADIAKRVFRGPDDFKNRKLLKFDPEQVARITIEYPDKTFELNKKEDQWVLIQPKLMNDLKPFVGKDILWTLKNLEYESKLESQETPSAANFGKPQMILTLQDQNNNTLSRLQIGQPVKDQPLVYSQLDNDSTLYSIKDRTLSEIPNSLDRFQKNEN